MNSGDKIEFYYNYRWQDGFYVGKFPSDWNCCVVTRDHTAYIVGKDNIRERLKKKVKPLKELVNILIDSGYLPNEEWAWMKTGHLGFNPKMFEYCGKEPATQFAWNEEWLEVESRIPGRDKPVMVRQDEDWAWELRRSTGELDSEGHLLCYNYGDSSSTAKGRTAWRFWREPTLEEMKK